jgi:hypothetical protein
MDRPTATFHYGAAVPRSEKIGYAIAVLILVVGGAFVKTAILNWISGPAIVVASVVVSTRLFGRYDREPAASEGSDA